MSINNLNFQAIIGLYKKQIKNTKNSHESLHSFRFENLISVNTPMCISEDSSDKNSLSLVCLTNDNDRKKMRNVVP